jgi:hypothetical protein
MLGDRPVGFSTAGPQSHPLFGQALECLLRPCRLFGLTVVQACVRARAFTRAGRLTYLLLPMGDPLPDESPSGLGRSGFLPASYLGITASLRMGEELFYWSPQWQGIGFRDLALHQTPSYPKVRQC